MKEEFLHYLWKYQLYNGPLKTLNGDAVEVLSAGEHNNDSGPDFFNSKVKIGSTIWAGNVEIHLKASDWYKHKHDKDEAYDNIILHAVAINDCEIKRSNNDLIPTVLLETTPDFVDQYAYLMNSKQWVACESFISKIDSFTIFSWKQSLMIERLEEKASIIENRWLSNNKDWEETFYQTLAANMGFKTNAMPFEMLAKSLPLRCLAKHKDQLNLLEAMLFGQSGLLPENPESKYVKQLLKDYTHLQNKFGLKPLKSHLWKFSKLRPGNFPTLRIAQFAALYHNSVALFSKLIEVDSYKKAQKLFQVEVSEYWKTHYMFEKKVNEKRHAIGAASVQNIIINTVTPFLVLLARLKNKPDYTDKAINWLSEIKPEENHITRHWKEMGLEIKNAFDSQSLIQLKNIYCKNRKCLNCRIGNQVIRHKF